MGRGIFKNYRWIVFLLVLCHTSTASLDAQELNYTPGDFGSPVPYELKLAGTFGELRSNHFHAGIDVKRKNKAGEPILSSAAGYISRIKVSRRGYGNAIYINHPNGYTTVYGHLMEFSGAIAQYVKQHQYSIKAFEFDKALPFGLITVNKGEQIGRMGNTGGSRGTHLHFEIRETASEKPVNPLHFGIGVVDTQKPFFHNLLLYHLDNTMHTKRKQKFRLYAKGGGKFGVKSSKRDTLLIGAWRTAIGVKVFDKMNGVYNSNGVYSLQIKLDGVPIHRFAFTKFAFDESRYCNAHLDYDEKSRGRGNYHRCYRQPGNLFSLYDTTTTTGIIPLEQGRAQKVEVEACDIYGNCSQLEFFVRRKTVQPYADLSYQYYLKHDKKAKINFGSLALTVSKNSFYEDVPLNIDGNFNPSPNRNSSQFSIGKTNVPIHRYIKLGILPNQMPSHLRDKAVITYKSNAKASPRSRGGKWEGDTLVAYVRNFGTYYVSLDTLAPSIRPHTYKANMSNYRSIAFKISDKLSGINTYDGHLDGKWVLFKYDQKSGIIRHHFEPNMPKGEHVIKMRVTDNRGNVKLLERTFIR